ncbi:hypothetical protein GKC56_06035 [Neisseriaceae bacterium PsAf]|nr:hypothetical protein [Neisseriaceae bacterium PsAf]
MNSDLFYSILTLVVIQFFALLTPGPDFFFISRQAMINTPKKQMLQAISGITTGVLIWASLSLLGLSKILNTYPAIQVVIAFFGGFYLLYIAYQIYHSSQIPPTTAQQDIPISDDNLYFKGLMINLLNPKAIVYFIVIFAPFVEKFDSISLRALTIAVIVIETFLWFYLISIIFSQKQLRNIYTRYQQKFDIASAAVFALFAIFLFYEFYPKFLQLIT